MDVLKYLYPPEAVREKRPRRQPAEFSSGHPPPLPLNPLSCWLFWPVIGWPLPFSPDPTPRGNWGVGKERWVGRQVSKVRTARFCRDDRDSAETVAAAAMEGLTARSVCLSVRGRQPDKLV
ncbi:hypothetical protein AAFF_G00347490 [Aldrovandia affinis]|uniref:Uncharacterized protein n=1 Tax=Aldrovandia affinis TaxID=143900 RepID=A0AAD7SLY0_9TELE|nr:hypothetical protein AAFF_G00347490 [Aldrovandia affinis]